jgi:hypothetical protein
MTHFEDLVVGPIAIAAALVVIPQDDRSNPAPGVGGSPAGPRNYKPINSISY